MRVPSSGRSRPYPRRGGRRPRADASRIGVGTRITRLPTDRLLARDRAELTDEWYSQQKAGGGAGLRIFRFEAVVGTGGQVTLTGETRLPEGDVYGIVDTDSKKPTAEQVRDGLNAAGAPALGKGSASVTTADLAVTITGLPSDTLLYGWLAQWV